MGKRGVLISKLGKTRAGERSRIWLEGKRLAAHGFHKGCGFHIFGNLQASPPTKWFLMERATYDRAYGHLSVTATGLKVIKSGSVAGTEERPIIDTVGALVLATFGAVGPTVRCEFHKGLIIIEAIPG